MRYLLLAVAASLTVAGCGSPSTLAEDDQTFCAEEVPGLVAITGDQLQEIIDGDQHWSSDGEPYALREVYIGPAQNTVRAFRPQDEQLRNLLDEVDSSLFNVADGLDGGDAVFADDAAVLRQAVGALSALHNFCKENA